MNAEIDVSSVHIETERLILRPWKPEDLEDLYEYARVPGVGEMAGWKHHSGIQESQKILQMFIREKKTLALQWKESGHVIGSLGLEELSPDPVAGNLRGREVGYVLSKACWGQGIMPEAVQAVIRFCFDTLGYDYLTCGHFSGNDRSRRVIEKCGFTYVKNVAYETSMGTQKETRLYILYNRNK